MGQDLLLGDSHKEVKKQLDVVRILPPAAVQKVEVVIVHEHDEADDHDAGHPHSGGAVCAALDRRRSSECLQSRLSRMFASSMTIRGYSAAADDDDARSFSTILETPLRDARGGGRGARWVARPYVADRTPLAMTTQQHEARPDGLTRTCLVKASRMMRRASSERTRAPKMLSISSRSLTLTSRENPLLDVLAAMLSPMIFRAAAPPTQFITVHHETPSAKWLSMQQEHQAST